MPSELTDITELATALGMLAPTLEHAFSARPAALVNVDEPTWERMREAWEAGERAEVFTAAFENGRSFAHASDGLRGRRPRRVEWKGPQRPPGDDAIPADLRIDWVYLVSCKYLSKVLLNPSPARLFDGLLVGDGRQSPHWFVEVAEPELQSFYEGALLHFGIRGFPDRVVGLDKQQQGDLRDHLRARILPSELQPAWMSLCEAVSARTVERWNKNLDSAYVKRRLLWRMLRISAATYFVLGADRRSSLRLRIDSAWDWAQLYDFKALDVDSRPAGQPEVGWQATVIDRISGSERTVEGHIEIRWSHGRFRGNPEAKVYLDTPLSAVPGYHPLG